MLSKMLSNPADETDKILAVTLNGTFISASVLGVK